MTKNKDRGAYVKKPTTTAAGRRRYEVVRQVLSGETTVTEAAKTLGLSRVRMQTIVHRAEQALLEASQPGTPGRPPAPPSSPKPDMRLERENQKLREDLARMRQALEMAADLLKDRIRTSTDARAPRSKAASSTRKTHDDDDPERPAREILAKVAGMMALGVPRHTAAALVGSSPATLARWRRRLDAGQSSRQRRGPGSRRMNAEAASRAVCIVRQLHGLIGAASLARSVDGLSRRQAAKVKSRALTEMERDRKDGASRVTVTRPGVVRGFDAMDVSCTGPERVWLIAADASVPYRTTIHTTTTYDAESVRRALADDIDTHGAPLVYRFDRHRSHRSGPVEALLDEQGVLTLSGPAHYPRYYGQLERQNREHRDWLEWVDEDQDADEAAEEMRTSLNESWRRPTLNWQSAGEVWRSRQSITNEDRDRFQREVYDRNSRLVTKLDGDKDMAWRLAIEHTLVKQHYLNLDRRVGAK